MHIIISHEVNVARQWRDIFLQKWCRKCHKETSPRPLFVLKKPSIR